MKKIMFKSSKVLIVVLAISALIFTGCSCGSKDKKDEKSTQKGVAATIINEDGSVEYVEDIIKDSKDDNGDVKNSSDDEDVDDLVGSGNSKSDSNKSNSKKSSSKKSSSNKSNSKKSNSNTSNGSKSSSSDSKKSDSKKSDSKSDSDKKSDEKEKTTKKSNFDIEKTDDDNRFGPIIDGKKK